MTLFILIIKEQCLCQEKTGTRHTRSQTSAGAGMRNPTAFSTPANPPIPYEGIPSLQELELRQAEREERRAEEERQIRQEEWEQREEERQANREQQ